MITTLIASAILIPSIGLREPVFVCPKNKKQAVQDCIDKHDIVKEHDMNVIYSHNYNSFAIFYNMEDGSIKIKRGDKIVFARQHYKVTAVKVVSDSSELPRSADIVLMTCFPFTGERAEYGTPDKRLIVLGRRI